MFTKTAKKYNPNDPKMVQRFCEVHEISDWRLLPKTVRLRMCFTAMPKFWAERSRWLNTTDPDELLSQTLAAHGSLMTRDEELLKFSDVKKEISNDI